MALLRILGGSGMTPIILIPARMAASRFPGKPLADLGGRPMIAHVAARALEAAAGPVAVAAGEPEIAEAARAAGAEAVMTGAHHQSGSDRIFEALGKIDPEGRHDVVINLQGDLPAVPPEAIRAVLAPLAADAACDIATLVSEFASPDELNDPNVVKALVSFPPVTRPGAHTGERPEVRTGRALDFTRAAPNTGEGAGAAYHHIGIYAYRRGALERFIGLPPSPREREERLEQLRALEAGMNIGAALVDSVSPGVDTPADLEKAAQFMGFAPAPQGNSP